MSCLTGAQAQLSASKLISWVMLTGMQRPFLGLLTGSSLSLFKILLILEDQARMPAPFMKLIDYSLPKNDQ